MEIDVTFTPADLAAQDKAGRTVVVIDVLRASTTMIQALANGCTRVLARGTVEEARTVAEGLPPAERLLGGERGGTRIPGFDHGNSPREYTPERVQGKTLAFTTTNGTQTIVAAQGAARILVGAFLNLTALVEELVGAGSPVLLAAAGRLGRPVLDDTLCAGLLVQQLQERWGERATLSDPAMIAWQTYRTYADRLLDGLYHSASGQNLVRLGPEYEADLAVCAQVGTASVIPVVRDGVLVPLTSGQSHG